MWKNGTEFIKSQRFLWAACAALFLVLVFSVSWFFASLYPRLNAPRTATMPQSFLGSAGSPVASPEEPREYKILFVGDIMLSREVGKMTEKKGDWRWPFLNSSDVLRGADITFGNLESPVSSRGVRVGSIYSFRADPRMVQGLEYAGFDVLSIANNHAWDYGREAFLDTLAHLASAGIDVVGGGENSDRAHAGIIRILPDGTRVAFLAYTDLLSPKLAATKTSAGAAVYKEEEMVRDITEASIWADVVIVSFHTGVEYKTFHNAHQETIYRKAVDAGADLIIGHHPHVVQDIEQYKKSWIIYSLGNFIFDQNFSKDTMEGLAVQAVIRNGKVSGISRRTVNISREFQPAFAPEL